MFKMVTDTKNTAPKNLPMSNKFLQYMRSRNFSTCRFSSNFYGVEHNVLPVLFHFMKEGRVMVQPKLKNTPSRLFFTAELTVESIDELMRKCVRIGLLNQKDHDRYFK
jgi:hypothetical protein